MQLERIEVKFSSDSSSARSYPVLIAPNLFAQLPKHFDFKRYSQIFVVTEEHLANLYLAALSSAIGSEREVHSILIASGEKNKTIATAELIWHKLLSLGADRKSLVINMGGGLVGDLGGFAAATYMRGIDFIQIPTTLLSQVDASVGGKVAANFEGVKNIIGSFQQPQAVFINIDTLKTLPQTEFSSGLAEVIKHGLICDYAYFEWLESKDLFNLSSSDLTYLIKRSCEIKSQVVAQDEQESGCRKLLNFGHTVGHALESLSYQESGCQPLLHGYAVALGMLVEAKISLGRGLMTERDFERIAAAISTARLPLKYPATLELTKFFDLIAKDKKSSAGKIDWTLLQSIGTATFNESVSYDEIVRALDVIS